MRPPLQGPTPGWVDVGAGHIHALFVPGDSPLHRVAPQCKIAGLFLFVLAVATTPREAFWAFGIYATVIIALALVGRLARLRVVKRMLIELPFLTFAFFLPIVGRGERIQVMGLSLAVDGLWGAWNIVAKGTLGLAASVVLAGTTPVTELLHGLDRLRLPRVLTAVTGFMVRYLDVTTAEAQRMSVARQSRGYDPRWIWQAKAVASSAGTLFIRSYERGERVYLAMVARGYTGSIPLLDEHEVDRRDWALSLAVPIFAALVSLSAWTLYR